MRSFFHEPFVSQAKANYCVIVSAFGIVFLVVIGSLINARDPVLIGGKEPLKESEIGAAVSSSFIAAGIYFFFTILCSWQSWLNSRIAPAEPEQLEFEEDLRNGNVVAAETFKPSLIHQKPADENIRLVDY